MTTVTLVTANAASADNLSEQDYRDIYDELRGKVSLRQFAEAIGSHYSFAWWSKYERKQAELSRQARNELRRAVGLAQLPPTVAEATASIEPDATVHRVGDQPVSRVILVGQPGPITMRLNGSLDILPESHVTGVTPTLRHRPRGSIVIDRETWERLNAARLDAGLSWDMFVSKLIA